jgi:hypothetical protein
MRSPRLRAVLAALHWGRCTRLALPHASSITRESPGVVARSLPMFESKVLRRPAANYELMLQSCNGSRQHFLDCCVRATQIRDNSILTLRFCEVDGFRRSSRCGSLRLRPRPRSNSPPGERAFNGVFAAWANRASLPVLRVHDAASMTVSFRHTASAVIPRLVRTCARGRVMTGVASGAGRCQARLPQPARLAFRSAKLSINAENPGSGTTTR